MVPTQRPTLLVVAESVAEGIDRRWIAAAMWQWRRDVGREVCRDEFGSTACFHGAAVGSDFELDTDSQTSQHAGAAWCADWTRRRNVAGE
jgi:hypothetical protein